MNRNDTYSTVRFGDVAREVTESTHSPLEDGFEYYIGLEHLDPESLKIRRWGLIEETETTFTRIFRAGQVLFGRRRAYQRKAALAEFDGICSGDIIVMEAKPGKLLPELLPFIVQTEGFYEHALSTSAGSLSPRTKWSALAKYEFPLPPLDEQRRIAEILWAVEDAIECYTEAITEAKNTLARVIKHLMQHGRNGCRIVERKGIMLPENWEVHELQELAAVNRGKFAHRPRNLPIFYGGPYPFVQTGDVAASDGLLTAYEQTLSEEGKEISRSFPTGSILMTIAAVIGKTAVTTFEVWCPDSVVGIEPDPEKIDTDFLEYYLRTIQSKLENQTATQTAQKNINLAVIRPLPIPVPPKSEQIEIAEVVRSFRDSVYHIQAHVSRLYTLKKKLVEEILF